ncbi:MAG: Spy/CpxP family protein refolding chaperone [Bacteroidia bacterium]|jgi:hypothetical protein
MKTFLLIWATLFTCVGLKAQDDMPGGPPERQQQIESYRIAFITEKLNLTPKEAAAFWPVYNEYEDQIKAMRMKDRDRVRNFREKASPTEQDADKFINEHLTFRQQEIELTRKYMVEFRKVLPSNKAAILLTLEQEFKMQLLRRIKDRRN